MLDALAEMPRYGRAIASMLAAIGKRQETRPAIDTAPRPVALGVTSIGATPRPLVVWVPAGHVPYS